ncbi:MAG TPA: hypothetical protein VF808_13855 [Ktedonobacterales bacterium]
MTHDGDSGDWDTFNWETWGAPARASESDGAPGDGPGANGHAASDGMLRRALADSGDDEGPSSAGGGWVAHGGVLRWNASDEEDPQTDAPLREEAHAPWAAEDFELPLGAPAAPRVRAVRAWLARRRRRETDLIGELLLERRRLYPTPEDGDPPALDEANPLSLALTEAQATADEYETLLTLLEDVRAHNGPQGVLIEYHLVVTERLATLAADPAAPDGFAERTLYSELTDEAAAARAAAPAPTPRDRAEWEGRAAAVLAARQRVERVTASEEGE